MSQSQITTVENSKTLQLQADGCTPGNLYFSLYVKMVAGPAPGTFTWFLPSVQYLSHSLP